MPLYHFSCETCGKKTRKILGMTSSQLSEAKMTCTCGGLLKRQQEGAPTAQKVESLDNGIMPKKVERLAEAERLFHEYRQTGNKS